MLSMDMVEAALAAVQTACGDGTRLLVIAGAGKNFCTGLNLTDLDTDSDGDLLLRLVRIETLLDAVWRAPCVTMGIGRGRAMGAGADLFTACDRRVAIEGSSYTFPGAAFGVALGTRRLMERIGADLARDMVRSGNCCRDGSARVRPSPPTASTRIIAARRPRHLSTPKPTPHPPLGRCRPCRGGALGRGRARTASSPIARTLPPKGEPLESGAVRPPAWAPDIRRPHRWSGVQAGESPSSGSPTRARWRLTHRPDVSIG